MKKICLLFFTLVLLGLCACSSGTLQTIKTDPDEIKLQLNTYKDRAKQGDGSFPIINTAEKLYGQNYYFQIDTLLVLCVYQDHEMQVRSVIDCEELFPESKDAISFLKFDFSSSVSPNGRYILLRGPETWYLFDAEDEKLQRVTIQSNAMMVGNDGKLVAANPPEETQVNMEALEQYAYEKAAINSGSAQNIPNNNTEEFENQLLKEQVITYLMPCNDGEREILYDYVFACAVDGEFSSRIIKLKY